MQNIVILAGNIGQKPEVRATQSGTKITNFTLATSRPHLSEGRVMRDENGYPSPFVLQSHQQKRAGRLP